VTRPQLSPVCGISSASQHTWFSLCRPSPRGERGGSCAGSSCPLQPIASESSSPGLHSFNERKFPRAAGSGDGVAQVMD